MKLDWIESAQSEPMATAEQKALIWRIRAWVTLKIKQLKREGK